MWRTKSLTKALPYPNEVTPAKDTKLLVLHLARDISDTFVFYGRALKGPALTGAFRENVDDVDALDFCQAVLERLFFAFAGSLKLGSGDQID